MNELEFRNFLKQNRRKPTAIEQIVELVNDYKVFFEQNYPEKTMDQTTTEAMESYVSQIESEPRESASKPLWALRYYFDFIGNQALSDLAGDLRAERIKRKPFRIRDFRGVNLDQVAKLEALYIENIDQRLDAGRTPMLRTQRAEKADIPITVILEYVKLSDLARLGAVRSVRARLYHDAGLIPETIAQWEPAALHDMLAQFVVRTNFDGIAPLPKEVQNLVANARKLPPLVIYEPESGGNNVV